MPFQIGRYTHAQHFKRRRNALKNLKGDIGRAEHDLRRYKRDIPAISFRESVLDIRMFVRPLLHP